MPCVCDDSSTEASVGGGAVGGGVVGWVVTQWQQWKANTSSRQETMRQSEMELFLNTSPNHGNAAANPA